MAQEDGSSQSGLITCLNHLTDLLPGLDAVQQTFLELHSTEVMDTARYMQNPFAMPTNRHECETGQPICTPQNPPVYSGTLFRNLPLPPITKKDCRTATAQAFDSLVLYPKMSGDPGVRFDFTDAFYVSDSLHIRAVVQAKSAHDKFLQSGAEGKFTSIKRKWAEEDGGEEHATVYALKESAALIAGIRAYVCEVLEFFRNRLPKHSVMFKPIMLPGAATQLEFLEQLLHGAPPFLQTTIDRALGSLSDITGESSYFPYSDMMIVVFDVLNLTKMAEEKRCRIAREAAAVLDDEVEQAVRESQEVLSTVHVDSLWYGPPATASPVIDEVWEDVSVTVQQVPLSENAATNTPTNSSNDVDNEESDISVDT